MRRNGSQLQTGQKGGGGFTSATMYWKQEKEINNIHKFAAKFPGVGDMSKLPSGLIQVREMTKPHITWLWKLKHLVRLFYECLCYCSSKPLLTLFCMFNYNFTL